MKILTKPLILALLFACKTFSTSAQDNKIYYTSGIENIFSFANITSSNTNNSLEQKMRYTLFFNIQNNINYDFSRHIGIHSGVQIRNVGFTYDGNDINQTKHRSYSLGIPIGLKIGNLDKGFFIFGGAEYEWMFAYKSKEYVGDRKVIVRDWFSDRTNTFIPSVYGGISFKSGVTLSAKYYLDHFLNQDFVDNDTDLKPFENLETRMFYISLGFSLFEKDDEGVSCPVMQ